MRNQDFLANAAQPALDTTKNNHHAAKLKLKKTQHNHATLCLHADDLQSSKRLPTPTQCEEFMTKQHAIFTLLIVAFLFTGTNASFAQTQPAHPAPDVDGEVWMKSSDLEKKAFLYGAGSAFVLEYHLRDKHGQEPSKLVKGWVDGLKDLSWADLSNRVDDYYKHNPDKTQRHVFDVIWHEVIAKNHKN